MLRMLMELRDMMGEQAVVQLLLREGADQHRQDHRGRTPLFLSIQMHRPWSIIKLLLRDVTDFDVFQVCCRSSGPVPPSV